MNTRETLQAYLESLRDRKDWKAFLADDMAFESFGTPSKKLAGREAYVESTKRFYSMIKSLEIKDLFVEGDKACALTRYVLQPPAGPDFESNVAEIFEVRDGRIVALSIYFDSAVFPKA